MSSRPSGPPAADALKRLADAVAGGRRGNVLVIRDDNTSGGWVDLDQAVALGVAFAVIPAEEVLALDCDDSAGARTFDAIATQLIAAGAEPVIVESGGGPDRRHLFCRVDRRDLRVQLAIQARGSGIDVRDRSPIRPPGSPHRTGAAPALLSHARWEDAAAALSSPPRQVSSRLPQTLWLMITKGDTKGRYRRSDGSVDGSRLSLAICNSAVYHGVDRDRIRRLLGRPENVGGASYQRRLAEGNDRADRWFDATWDTAAQSSWRPRPIENRNDALVAVAELRCHAAHWRFTGRTGSTDSTVLEACLVLAEGQGGPVAHLSVRTLAETSGRSVPTVRKALVRLQTAGWLELLACSDRDRSARYRVGLPTSGCNGCTDSSSTGGVGTVQSPLEGRRDLEPGHDAFTPGALGATGWRVLAALGEDREATPGELASGLGVHVTTARRALHRLSESGLVELLVDGSWRRLAVSVEVVEKRLAETAERCGTAGRRERKILRHRFERSQYRVWVEARDDRRVAAGERVPLRWVPQGQLWGRNRLGVVTVRAHAPPKVA